MALIEGDRLSSDAKRRSEKEGGKVDQPAADRSRTAREVETRAPKERDLEDKAKKSSFNFDSFRRHSVIAIAVAAAILAVLVAGLLWWLNARHFESTDDAFIDTRTVPISAQVAGAIIDVLVTDNEFVAAGAPLMRIDPRDYRAALDQAQAKLDEAQASVGNFDAQIDAQHSNIELAQKQVSSAQAALDFSQEQQKRAQELLSQGAGTQQTAQQTSSDLRQKQAALAGAQASAIVARKQLAVLDSQRTAALAQVEEARANLMQARTNLDRTTIRAPEDGRVAKLSAAKGAYAQPGQSQMMFVPRSVWVTANFKETQLGDMRVGQPVDIAVDAYSGKTFHGHVDSIQPGSGTVFSLLPAENATGNYVKVVQRVPVKIVFEHPPDVYLGPGMSVEPSVRVR
ncbi:MAG: HlyD family secretion protein [Pseudolabrys sp.]